MLGCSRVWSGEHGQTARQAHVHQPSPVPTHAPKRSTNAYLAGRLPRAGPSCRFLRPVNPTRPIQKRQLVVLRRSAHRVQHTRKMLIMLVYSALSLLTPSDRRPSTCMSPSTRIGSWRRVPAQDAAPHDVFLSVSVERHGPGVGAAAGVPWVLAEMNSNSCSSCWRRTVRHLGSGFPSSLWGGGAVHPTWVSPLAARVHARRGNPGRTQGTTIAGASQRRGRGAAVRLGPCRTGCPWP